MRVQRTIAAETDIDAPIEVVWDILADVARYPEWNPFTHHVETSFEIGAPIKMHVRLGRFERLQVEYISAFEPPHRMCWGADFVSSRLMQAERCQTLTALAGGRTHYRSADVFTGPLVPLVLAFFATPVQNGF